MNLDINRFTVSPSPDIDSLFRLGAVLSLFDRSDIKNPNEGRLSYVLMYLHTKFPNKHHVNGIVSALASLRWLRFDMDADTWDTIPGFTTWLPTGVPRMFPQEIEKRLNRTPDHPTSIGRRKATGGR